jgi:hypothetical protein
MEKEKRAQVQHTGPAIIGCKKLRECCMSDESCYGTIYRYQDGHEVLQNCRCI